jgi:uracil-DNA glycosylase family protein
MGSTRGRRPSPQTRLEELRGQARECRNCPLWKVGTQTVFGSGPSNAALMLVGEQPGDQEDLAGEPFVGPAGRLLRETLEQAGIDPASVYLTNAVKHFKWTPRGKRRIHEKPNREEILACRLWLDQEIATVAPRAIVALGATAAGVLLGPKIKVMRDRGTAVDSTLAPVVAVTVHPSSILRSPSDEQRRQARADFLRDLKAILALMNAPVRRRGAGPKPSD